MLLEPLTITFKYTGPVASDQCGFEFNALLAYIVEDVNDPIPDLVSRKYPIPT